MNSNLRNQLVHFLSTTIAVALGVIIATVYQRQAEKEKPKEVQLIQIENWEGQTENLETLAKILTQAFADAIRTVEEEQRNRHR